MRHGFRKFMISSHNFVAAMAIMPGLHLHSFFLLPILAFQASALQINRRTAIETVTRIGGTVSAISTIGIGAGIVIRPADALAASSVKPLIEDRLEADTLTLPPPSRVSEFNGVDNFYFPTWMAGEWEVTQTMRRASTPLGLKFVGGPNASEEIATKSMEEQRKQIGVPVNLKLRWIQTKWGVAEDRLFNTRQRLDGFAGKSVVASVEYANVGGSNRASVLGLGGKEDDPLQTIVVRFKGPAAQKTFVIAHGEEYSPETKDKWAGHETLRSIFALTNENTAPPVTTDTEIIWSLQRISDSDVKGSLRIASYLNAQSDSLFFEARNRAVSFADYDLTFKRAQVS